MAEISDKKYEELRRILEKQNKQLYTLEEIKQIGDGLIDFYNLLIEFNREAKLELETFEQQDRL